ncbi:MAG: NTP transferase domain-containing protein, partial [Giesbergeria sp.]
MNPIDIVIMAAGKGTRMKSRLPKVLQRLAGRPLLQHVLGQASALGARSAIVVTGHGAMEVEAACAGAIGAGGQFDLKFVRQEPQLGTGHAVQQAAPLLQDDGTVVVLSGDVPLTQPGTVRALVQASADEALALLTVRLPDPKGYGRIVRGADGLVRGIVEEKDASDAQRTISEVYSGILAVPARLLLQWLPRLSNQNAQGEYYLTEVVAMAVAQGVPVTTHTIDDAVQVAGVNSPAQLAELERAHQSRAAIQLMEQGVRLSDPACFDLRDDARSG